MQHQTRSLWPRSTLERLRTMFRNIKLNTRLASTSDRSASMHIRPLDSPLTTSTWLQNEKNKKKQQTEKRSKKITAPSFVECIIYEPDPGRGIPGVVRTGPTSGPPVGLSLPSPRWPSRFAPRLPPRRARTGKRAPWDQGKGGPRRCRHVSACLTS